MIDTSKITAAIESILKSDTGIIQHGMAISRSEYLNLDPDATPWVGIYAIKTEYDPRSLGVHASSWNGTVEIKLLVQASNLSSGGSCEDSLGEYVQSVLDAVWSDPSLNSTVDMITDLSVDYVYNEAQDDTIYYQWAEITLILEVSTG